ncbi:hypothetical protein A994_07741 [Methanobacterium formicicum DSM 3637]|uniref:Uncharacterized protein n=1 Tax=Methanobacterium formicicum (strain DSM 3637 / PP1) TaxID=1204725 RepID=K2R2Z5_METFP|nr:hypothetical protein A994_07741 [Methanobacterium formicicum DSM 3637]
MPHFCISHFYLEKLLINNARIIIFFYKIPFKKTSIQNPISTNCTNIRLFTKNTIITPTSKKIK